MKTLIILFGLLTMTMALGFTYAGMSFGAGMFTIIACECFAFAFGKWIVDNLDKDDESGK